METTTSTTCNSVRPCMGWCLLDFEQGRNCDQLRIPESSVAYVEHESDEDYDGPIGISSTVIYPVEVIGHREDPWMGRVALIRMTGRVPSGAARVHEVHADDVYVTAVSA